jgi:hypothetical protein
VEVRRYVDAQCSTQASTTFANYWPNNQCVIDTVSQPPSPFADLVNCTEMTGYAPWSKSFFYNIPPIGAASCSNTRQTYITGTDSSSCVRDSNNDYWRVTCGALPIGCVTPTVASVYGTPYNCTAGNNHLSVCNITCSINPSADGAWMRCNDGRWETPCTAPPTPAGSSSSSSGQGSSGGGSPTSAAPVTLPAFSLLLGAILMSFAWLTVAA